MSKYQYETESGEISGFGGGYEETCRKMVIAGMEWFDEHPNAEPKFHGYEGIYGILDGDNDDAKALSAAVVAPTGGDCTGAMHQATIGHVLYAHKHGWTVYLAAMRQKSKE